MKYGVYSETGKLRKAIVCRPGLAHMRLTPGNCRDLLFDDVIWVGRAKAEHQELVDVMKEHGVGVLELHDLLSETLGQVGAREWVIDRTITPDTIGLIGLDELRDWLLDMPSGELAERLKKIPSKERQEAWLRVARRPYTEEERAAARAKLFDQTAPGGDILFVLIRRRGEPALQSCHIARFPGCRGPHLPAGADGRIVVPGSDIGLQPLDNPITFRCETDNFT